MVSILESNYVAPTRPYSQDELQYMRQKLYRSLRLSNIKANHKRSGHFYFVKQNGRKEKEIIETNNSDVGNCSVSWKLNKTPDHLYQQARRLVECYEDTFREEPEYLSYSMVETERVFYKWLYEEN